MKGFLAAMLFLGMLVVDAGAQTIVNPGFEQELTEWAPRLDYGMSKTVADAAKTGSFGLRVTDTSDTKSSGLESLAVEAEAGKSYEVSFQSRTISGEGGVMVSLRFFDSEGKSLQKKKPTVVVKGSPEWQRFAVKGKAPEGAVAFGIVIQSIALEQVTADFDDFECKVVE